MNPLLILPKVNKEASLQEQVTQMQSQIFQLKEQIEMLLSVMGNETKKEIETAKTGLEDFVQSSVVQNGDFKSIINQKSNEIMAKVEDVQGDVSQLKITSTNLSTRVSSAEQDATEAKQTATSLEMNVVKKGEVISSINASQEGVAIKGDRISLEGVTTINNRFMIDSDGYLHLSSSNAAMEVVDNGGSYRNLTGFLVTNNAGDKMCYGAASIVDEYGNPVVSTLGIYNQFGNLQTPTLIDSSARPRAYVDHQYHDLAYLEDIQGGGDTNAEYLVGTQHPSLQYGSETTYWYDLFDTDGNNISTGNNRLATTGWVLAKLKSLGLNV